MDVQRCGSLVINTPEFFVDPAFREWLTNDQPKFTWYKNGEIDEWSDVIVPVDPGLNGEGSDSDMPEYIWDYIVDACRNHLGAANICSNHYMVRLTNLTAD